MPLGVAMYSAFWAGRKARISSAELERQLDERELTGNPRDLRCEECSCAVQFVRGYFKNREDPERTRFIPSFFRLSQPAEHTADCPYTAEGAIRQLVARSRAIRELEDPFADREGGGYEFRLNLLARVRRNASADNEQKQGGKDDELTAEDDKEKKRRRQELIWNGQTLAPYLSAAVDIAKLCERLEAAEDQALLRRTINLRYGRREVPWAEFLYETERFRQLYKRLQKSESGFLEHPVATIVHIQAHAPDRNLVRCIWDEDGDKRYALQLTGVERLLDALEPRHSYVVFGEPRIVGNPVAGQRKNGTKVTWFNLRMPLYSTRQFAPVHG